MLQAVAVAVTLCGGLAGASAEERTTDWQVGKSSGEVWIRSSSAQPVALGAAAVLKPGDSIQTGRHGRVLLVRGQDSILIAPNSSITLPPPGGDATTTTILQQAGSILLEVDRKGPRSFEVETPYLVAAVKGTSFRVSLTGAAATVDVVRGAVEVAHLRSGQHAAVLAGQSASVPIHGDAGLSLSGAGTLGPVLNGPPRAPSIDRLSVPRRGLSAPRGLPAGQHVHRLRSAAHGAEQGKSAAGGRRAALRIAAPIGEIKLNVQKATGGLVRASVVPGAAGRASGKTFWSSGEAVPGNGVGKTYNTGNSGSGNGNAYGLARGNGNAGENGNAGGNGVGNGNGNGNGLALGHEGGGNGGGNRGGKGHGHGRGKK